MNITLQNINKQLTRFLSILFLGMILLLTYIACLLFLANVSPGYKYPFRCLFCNHSLILSIFIYNCSRIEQQNWSFLKMNQKCLNYLPMIIRKTYKVYLRNKKLINNILHNQIIVNFFYIVWRN